MNIRADRPRIFLDEARLAYLRTPEAQARPQWTRMLKFCDDNWLLPTGTKGRDQYHANLYGLVYAVTGSERHGRKAIAMCEIYMGMPGFDAMTRVGATSGHGYGARIVLPEVACTYDWCYDLLTSAERTRWQEKMLAWADWCWLETNPTKPTTWGQSRAGDNFFHGFMQTGLVGLALAGDHPRGQFHADFAVHKWETMWRPYLERYGSSYSLEGTAYGTWRLLSYLIAAYKTATGDYDALSGTEFLEDAVRGRIHLTAPGFKHLTPLGEQPSNANALITDYHRALPLVAMSHCGPITAGLARDWLDRVPPPRWRWTAWEEALWYDHRWSPLPVEDEPTTYHFKGADVVSARSSWEDDATWLVYQCGPDLESHQDHGAGAAYLWKAGGWITAPARLWATGGGLLPTEFTNAITVGGHGQPAQSTNPILPKSDMRITSVEDTGAVLIIDSQFARAYAYKVNVSAVDRLKDARRRLIWIKPSTLLIIDRYERVTPANEIVLMMQTKDQAILNGSHFGVVTEESSLEGKVLQPANASLRVVEIKKGPGGALSSYRLEVVVPGGSPVVEVTRLMEVG